MMMQKIAIWGLMLLPLGLLGQKDKDAQLEDNSNLQFLIENLVENSSSEDFDFGTQFEDLEIYAKNPIDLNSATEDDLNEFGLLSSLQIRALLSYRKKYGQIYSLYELQGVAAFNARTIIQIAPYVAVSKKKEIEKMNLKRWFKYGRSQVFARYQRVIEEQKGFSPLEEGETGTRFLGTPDKLYMRYRMTYRKRMSLGITMENDPGEEFFKGSNKYGFDYYSAHLYLKQLNNTVHSLAIGDYQAYFGQGLTMWGGFGISKSAQVMNIKRMSLPIRPYSSVNEALFMRGAAVHLQFLENKNLELTLFGSYRNRDANISSEIDSLSEVFSEAFDVSSLQEGGFHRTTSEIEDENSIQVATTGARVRYVASNWQVAGNVVYNQLSNELNPTSSSLYQRYRFSGTQTLNTSLDYAWNYKNLQFFGETATNLDGGLATLNGLMADLDPKVSVALLQRHYSAKYHTLNGNGFGEGSGLNNETGMYLGLVTRLGGGFKLSGYYDMFEFKWLRFLTDAPSRGHEYFTKLEYTPNYYLNTYIQYRFEQKGRNLSGNTTNIDQIINAQKQNLRFHIGYDISREFGIRSRVEFSWFEAPELNQGFVLYQDFIYKPAKFPLKAQVRMAVFNAPDYNTRIYAYENDVLYAFSVVPYYGQGIRTYLNLSYKFNRKYMLWFRIAQTYYTDRDVISSGLGEIQGNTRTDFKVQFRAKF